MWLCFSGGAKFLLSSHSKELSTSVDCPDFWTFDEEKSAAKVQPYLPDYFEPKAGMPVRHKAPSLQRVVEFVEVEHRVDGFFPGGFLCPRTHVSKAHTHTQGTQDIEVRHPRDHLL